MDDGFKGLLAGGWRRLEDLPEDALPGLRARAADPRVMSGRAVAATLRRCGRTAGFNVLIP